MEVDFIWKKGIENNARNVQLQWEFVKSVMEQDIILRKVSLVKNAENIDYYILYIII